MRRFKCFTLKGTFSTIISSVLLNLIIIVVNIEACSVDMPAVSSFLASRATCGLVQYPCVVNFSEWSTDITLGKDGLLFNSSASRPFGNLKSIDFTAQSLSPWLLITKSNQTCSQNNGLPTISLRKKLPIEIEQFEMLNTIGLGSFSLVGGFGLNHLNNVVLNEKTLLTNPSQNTIAPSTPVRPQNTQSIANNIPEYKYIFYRCGFFVFSFLIIIESIIRLIGFVCQVHNSQIEP